MVLAQLSFIFFLQSAAASDPRRRRSHGSTPTEIAKQANALFAKDDDGVLFRMVHEDLSSIDKDKSGNTTLSFVRLNKYAWGDGKIQLFKDGALPGIMGKPHANKHVKCQYPCDGDTEGRQAFHDCHVKGCPCDAAGKDEWCDHKLTGKPHKPCAFKPDETAKMMKAFRDVQDKKSPLLNNQACGYYHIPGESHNEVVIDPRTWDAHIKDNLWAFVLTDACKGACEKSLRRLHDGAKKKYGDIPLLSFNRKDKEHPFHVPHSSRRRRSGGPRRRRSHSHRRRSSGTEEEEEKASDAGATVAPASKDEDEAATNMSIRVEQANNLSNVFV